MASSTKTKKKEKKRNKEKTGAGGRKRSRRSASTSDKHELYELSVQSPEAECEFIDKAWKQRRGRLAHHVREDFCGTAIASIAWVKLRPDNTAVGVDIDPAVLAWAQARLPERLEQGQRERIRLIQGDVRSVRTGPVDCVLAMNFSYYLLKTRRELLEYFGKVRGALVEDGMFLLDAYGGSDAFVEMQEKRKVNGFTYIWDQHSYNPITGDAINHIHYKFPDGTELKRAFTYDWRLWTLPELRELLLEAGFADVTVYWEGTDEKTGEGNDEFNPSLVGEACPGWIAYLVAEK